MHFSSALVALVAATLVSGHGTITEITGSNGVTMPGLTVIEGTPRDCSSNGCGSQADTAIIRQRELGTNRASALGRTQGAGPVDAAAAVADFMGTSAAAKRKLLKLRVRQLLGGLLGGGRGGNAAPGTPGNTAPAVLMTGQGASTGLPTCGEDGSITMTFRQVNQDGAGPLTAMIDSTSGGTDPAAFEAATMTADVPGIAAGFSAATIEDFQITAQMAPGTVCSGTVAGETNVCIVRVNNQTPAGPFGGSAAFTQTAGARKRAIEYNRRMKNRKAKKF